MLRISTKSRDLPKLRNCNLDSMTIPMKKWSSYRDKHGDWHHIWQKDIAEQNGVDIAPLIDDFASLMETEPLS